MKIVLDTNIIISGLLSKTSPPAKLLQAWSVGKFDLVTSLKQIDELKRVFTYPHIKSRINTEQSKRILHNLDAESEVLEHLPIVNLSSDPDDNCILAAAISGGAKFIVSGDKQHLLSLHTVEGIPIISAREAIRLFQIDD